MSSRRTLYIVALPVLTAILTAYAVSQDSGSKGDQAAEDEEKLINNFAQYAMPGEYHKVLEKLAGQWNMAIKYRMRAEAPVVESTGTCMRKWILGERFILEEFDGGDLGLPFAGLAIYGYDSFERKYTSAWVDTTNNAITTNLGVCRDSCDVITFTGQHGDPWSGVKRPSRGVTRFVSDNEQVLELYERDEKGKEYRILEIVYTRRKAPQPK